MTQAITVGTHYWGVILTELIVAVSNTSITKSFSRLFNSRVISRASFLVRESFSHGSVQLPAPPAPQCCRESPNDGDLAAARCVQFR
jgi:hypothetical protein